MTDDPLRPARDAAFMKLGRNIALFQQLEAGLKDFIVVSEVQGANEQDIAANSSERRASVTGKSMGKVAKRFFDELGTASRDDAAPPGAGNRIWLRTRFGVEGPFMEERRIALEALIAERNRLIHHLNEDFNLRTLEGIAQLDQTLDPQAERIRHELLALQEMFGDLGRMREAMAGLLASDEYQQWFELAWLQASDLVQGLGELAQQLARPDGWTVLQLASNRLQALKPEAMQNRKARFGSDSIKALLIKSGIFELWDEPTSRGGTRLLYRLCPPAPESADNTPGVGSRVCLQLISEREANQ